MGTASTTADFPVSLPRLSGYDYDADHFYDCGRIARTPSKVQDYAAKHVDDDWDATLNKVKGVVARLLDPENPTPAQENLALFYNTTAAVQRVFGRVQRILGNQGASILTSDFEYPGCIGTLKDQWTGPVTIAGASEYHSSRPDDQDRTSDAIKRAFLIANPRVVYLSHVSRYTGYVIPEELLSFFRDVNRRCIVILDGAQALGNVVVSRHLLNLVDFYIVCGHKWLGGLPSLGLVWSRHGGDTVEDYAQGLAAKVGTGGTANNAGLLSILKTVGDMTGPNPSSRLAAIARHNQGCSHLFLDAVSQSGYLQRCIRPLPQTRMSGLVACAIQHPDFPRIAARKQVMRSTGRRPVEFSCIGSEIWAEHSRMWALRDYDPTAVHLTRLTSAVPHIDRRYDLARGRVPNHPHGILRFCFHYYHDQKSIADLVAALDRAARGCLRG